MSDEVGSEDDSDEDYSSIAEDESESGKPMLATCNEEGFFSTRVCHKEYL